ncbi:HWE histidine kinase domain-containing protein [Qipengyuania sp. CAU 1752]
MPAPELCEDGERLRVLSGFGVDGLQDDPELNEIARFAATLCDAPIALVSVVEKERQRFLARRGLTVLETPREYSFCAHAMLGDKIFVVNDATTHPSFATNPLVTGEPHIRFYAGAPLVSLEGAPMGSLCIIDGKVRPEGLSKTQEQGLIVLATAVMRRLEARRQDQRSERKLMRSNRRLRSIIDSVPDIAWSAKPGLVFDQFNARWREVTGLEEPRSTQDWQAAFHPDDWDASLAKFKEAVEQCKDHEDQWRLRQTDGTWRWVLSRAVPSNDDPERAHWFGTVTDIDDTYREAERQEMLANELAHRIKNIFSVIAGLVKLRSRGKPEVKSYAEELEDTIRALGRAQDFVMPLRAKKGDSLRALLDILTAPYGSNDERQVHVSGDTVKIGFHSATPMALVFHELATNSAKYGALSLANGRIDVKLETTGTSIRVDWIESGGPAVSKPTSSGYGSRLLQLSVQSQLNGTIEQEWAEDGLRVHMVIPATSLEN